MITRVFGGAFVTWVLACHCALAAGDVPALRVPPVAERPIDKQTIAAEPKDDSIPAEEPASSPEEIPAPEATPGGEETAAPVPDTIVPEPFPVSRYAELWENSPFQLESVAPPQQSETLGQRFSLGGILRQSGEPIVWVRERATQQSHRVSRNNTNSLGLSLIGVNEAITNQIAATAVIRLGNEQGEVKFDAAPAGSAPNPAMSAPPVQAGLPGPGQPAVVPAPFGGQAVSAPGQAQASAARPGVVPSVPGPPVPPSVGHPGPAGQEAMPPPRVIRRRAIIPSEPGMP